MSHSIRAMVAGAIGLLGAAAALVPTNANATCNGLYYVKAGDITGPSCTSYLWDTFLCSSGAGQGPFFYNTCVPGSAPPVDSCDVSCPCTEATQNSPMCNPTPPAKPKTEDACVGDPFTTSNGASHVEMVDVDVPGPLGGLQFRRIYSSTPDDWKDDAPLDLTPSPFGASMTDDWAPQWTHSMLSMVSVSTAVWSVRERGGRLLRFLPCTGTNCFAPPTGGNLSIAERLQWTGSGFRLWTAAGEQLEFLAKYQRPGAGSTDRYFLSKVISPRGKTALELFYATPSGLTCPTGTGGGTDTGVPYLYEAKSLEATLRFSYAQLARADGGTAECVLQSAALVPPSGSATTVATYTYAGSKGGLLATAATGTKTESYGYASSGLTVTQAGTTLTSHATSGGQVSSDTWTNASGNGSFSSFSWGTGACVSGSNCCGEYPVSVSYTDTATGRGDGTATSANLQTTVLTLANARQEHNPRIYQTEDSCSGFPNACSAGTIRTEWTCSSADGGLGYELGTKDKRDNWQTKAWAHVDGGAGRLILEQRSSSVGAEDMYGLNPLETETYGYVYGAGNQQLLSTTSEDSVLVPTVKAVVTRNYDSTNRLASVTHFGYTKDLSGSNVPRIVGTWFNTSSTSCGITAGPDDAGRTLEVHGPCIVDAGATDCPSSSDPKTVLEYWSASETTWNRNRLKSVSRPGNSSTCLKVQFSDYDARGNAQTVTDENGVATTFTFDADSHVLTKTVAGKTWRYSYDNGMLSHVQQPAGNGDVFCYRTGGNDDCSTGTWTPHVQWTAKKTCSAGLCTGAWVERINYFYADDGTLASADYRSCPPGSTCTTATAGERRRTEKFATDAHKRPTRAQSGDGGTPVVSWQAYDKANNPTAVGHAWNLPPDFCLSSGSPSSLCHWLEFDRADRLARFDETQVTSPSLSVARTCFDYDTAGNVLRVSPGCTSSASCAINSPGSLSTCSTAPNDYVTDDFGNVVEAKLANTDNGSSARGVHRFEFDALGNVTKKQTEQQRQDNSWIQIGRDSLGRPERVDHVIGGTNYLVFDAVYDELPAWPPGGCPRPNNLRGRLAKLTDPLGPTWFDYDSEGHLLLELRLRNTGGGGLTSCGGTDEDEPSTSYSYTTNGLLASITYPHGREVSYQFGSGALADRVTGVSAKTWNGSAWNSPTVYIDDVRWEPYGSVRSYLMKFPTTGNGAAVEHQQGASESAPATECPTSPRSEADDTSGRLRAIWVSTDGGTAAGDIFQRTYTWKTDQVAKTSSCYLGTGLVLAHDFLASHHNGVSSVNGYDNALQLRSVVATNFPATGGPFEQRSYAFDSRGNRTAMGINDGGSSYTYVYGGGSHQLDRLTEYYSSTTSGNRFKFQYDRDGRVVEKAWAPDSSGDAGYTVRATYLSSGANGPGSDTAWKAVSVNGAQYLYWYDVENRRRRKDYPLGTKDEFFYDRAHRLLEDRGNWRENAGAPYPIDEYLWLDGKPVAMFRAKFDSSWSRGADSTGNCERLGENLNCGVYFFINDHLGRPIVTLDSSRRITGVGEGDPFGHLNRVEWWNETAHPYGTAAVGPVWSTISHPAHGMQMSLRFHFPLVDTEENQYGQVVEGPSIWSSPWATMYEVVGGYHRGDRYSNWVTPTPTGTSPNTASSLTLGWGTVANNCAPGSATCTPNNWAYAGYAVDNYEYRRFQSGAQSYFPPLRFPGHYFDAETDFFENWHRYLDPATGRYLQPEPLLSDTLYTQLMALEGHSTPTYAYALNNPVRYTDPTGLCPPGSSCAASAYVLPSGEVITMAEAVQMGILVSGTAKLAETAAQANEIPQGEIDQIDAHIAKIDEADARCENGLPPSDQDPNKDPREKHRRDLKGWISKLKAAAKKINNKAKREVIEKAIDRAQGRIDRPSPPAPPRP